MVYIVLIQEKKIREWSTPKSILVKLHRFDIYGYIVCIQIKRSRDFRGKMQDKLADVVQSLSRIRLLAIPPTAAQQTSLSFSISRSLLKLMSIESMMPSNHLILCCPFSSCPQPFPASGSFPMSCLFASSGQSIGASASASVLPKNIQGWFPLGLTGLISLLSKGLLRVISSTTVQTLRDIYNMEMGQNRRVQGFNHVFLEVLRGQVDEWEVGLWKFL